MADQEQTAGSPFGAIRHIAVDGSEYWSARPRKDTEL